MAKKLKDMTAEELAQLSADVRVEEARRKKEEEEARYKARVAYWEGVKDTLSFITLDALTEHERTSCSNDNVSNGLSSIGNGRNAPRCSKCALIELLNGSEMPESFADLDAKLTIQIFTRTVD